MSDELVEKVARAICRQNLVSTKQPDDAETIDAYWQSFKPEAISALRAIEEAGWVIVPKEPTKDMLHCASENTTGMDLASRHVWKDMLSARPRITGETE